MNAEVVKSKRAHGVPGRPGVLSDGSKAGVVKGGKRCGWCGRDGLKGVPGPGGYLVFHRAPVCGLPCKGANLKKLDSEDLKAGVHEKAKCPKCDARVAYK